MELWERMRNLGETVTCGDNEDLRSLSEGLWWLDGIVGETYVEVAWSCGSKWGIVGAVGISGGYTELWE